MYDVLLCQPNGKQSVPHRVSNPERCSAFRQNQAGTLRTGIPQGIEEQNANIRAIVDNTEAPDFENVIVAFDNSSPILNRVSAIFFNMTDAETSDALNELSIKLAPVLSEHGDNISLNQALFNKVQAVYQKKDSLNLTTEQQRLLDKTYKDFVRSGANLSAEKQARLREIKQAALHAGHHFQQQYPERKQ